MGSLARTGDASFDAENATINVTGNNNTSTATLNVFAPTAAGVDINKDAVVGAYSVTTNSNTTDASATDSNIGYMMTRRTRRYFA